MSDPLHTVIKALRSMPTPQPRPGFVDRAIALAVSAPVPARRPSALRRAAKRWEIWLGAALGGGAAAALTLVLMRPASTPDATPRITLALHESRDIGVLIEADRTLQDAVIRIVVAGGVALSGFNDERAIDWRADLERGPNLLSLPVVARSVGDGRLVATIEHGGRTRTVMVNLTISQPDLSPS